MWIEEGARGSEVGQKDGEAFATIGAEGGQASVVAGGKQTSHDGVPHGTPCSRQDWVPIELVEVLGLSRT